MPDDSPEFEALFEHYQEILDEMPATFTSHRFILTLAHRHQKQYIEFLYAHRAAAAPFQAVHLKLAKGLNRFQDQISKGERVPSKVIFDQSTDAREWHKT